MLRGKWGDTSYQSVPVPIGLGTTEGERKASTSTSRMNDAEFEQSVQEMADEAYVNRTRGEVTVPDNPEYYRNQNVIDSQASQVVHEQGADSLKSIDNGHVSQPRSSIILAGDERNIEGAKITFERKETLEARGVEVEPSQLLSDNFCKHPIVGDLLSRQYNSLSSKTQQTVQHGGDLYFLALSFEHKYGNIGAFQIIDTYAENAKLWNAKTTQWTYWLPQGKYLDIAKHPDSARQPVYVFTPNFSGCSFVVDELDENTLRVYHVEGGKENAQYNHISEHALGLMAYMSYKDYGYYEQDGATFENNAAFAFMKYNMVNKEWEIHYQCQEHSPTIQKYQKRSASMFRSANKPHEITAQVAKGTRIVGTEIIRITP